MKLHLWQKQINLLRGLTVFQLEKKYQGTVRMREYRTLALPVLLVIIIVCISTGVYSFKRHQSTLAPTKLNDRSGHVHTKQTSESIRVDIAFDQYKETLSEDMLVDALNANRNAAAKYLTDMYVKTGEPFILRLLGRSLAQCGGRPDWNSLEKYFGSEEQLNAGRIGFVEGLLRMREFDLALSCVDTLGEGNAREICRGKFLAMLADFDPDRAATMAVEWLSRGELGAANRSAAINAVAKGCIGDLDGKELESQISTACFGELTKYSPFQLGQLVAERNIGVAKNWAMLLENKITQRNAIVGISEVQERRGDRKGALNTILEAEKQNPGGIYLSTAIFTKAMRSPESAVEFLDSLPAKVSGSRDGLIAVLVNLWYGQDGIGVCNWASALAPGRDRDAACKALAVEVAPTDRTMAEQWAQEISNKERCNRVLEYIRSTTPAASSSSEPAASSSANSKISPGK
jgi:hypothetical protein